MNLETLQALQEGISTQSLETLLGINIVTLLIIIAAVIILKGLALFKSARRNEKIWFWCLLIFNTLGILPLIYLILRRKK